jgi:hypothetical protein
MSAPTSTWRGQFVAMGWGVGILALLWVLLVYVCWGQSVQTCAAESAAAVSGLDATSRMATAIQDVDARAADFLLTGESTADGHLQALLTQVHESDANLIDNRLAAFHAALIEAHRAMGGDMLNSVDTAYPEYLFQVRLEGYEYAHRRPSEARAAWVQSNHVMLEHIQPILDHVLTSGTEARHEAFDDAAFRLWRWNVVQEALAAALATLIMVSMGLLVWRTHRIVHVWLLLAIVAVVGGQWSLWSSFNEAGATLRSLDGSYAALRQVDMARQQASQANAAVSRSLEASDAALDQGFGAMCTHVLDGLSATSHTPQAAKDRWAQYVKLAGDVHQRASQGQKQNALSLDVGTASDVFVAFTDTVDAMEESEHHAFEAESHHVSEAIHSIRWWAWSPALVGLLLFLQGLRVRLADF